MSWSVGGVTVGIGSCDLFTSASYDAAHDGMRLMTGPADEELLDVVQRERKDYRNDLIAADTAEVEDQAERISRALRSASKSAVESSAGSASASASASESESSGSSAGQFRSDEPTGTGA